MLCFLLIKEESRPNPSLQKPSTLTAHHPGHLADLLLIIAHVLDLCQAACPRPSLPHSFFLRASQSRAGTYL